MRLHEMAATVEWLGECEMRGVWMLGNGESVAVAVHLMAVCTHLGHTCEVIKLFAALGPGAWGMALSNDFSGHFPPLVLHLCLGPLAYRIFLRFSTSSTKTSRSASVKRDACSRARAAIPLCRGSRGGTVTSSSGWIQWSPPLEDVQA